jgi:hypothetical protein
MARIWTGGGSMSVLMTCDYCGEAITAEQTYITLSVAGRYQDRDAALGHERVNFTFGHYHTGDTPDGYGFCWNRVYEAAELVSVGGELERIPVLTGQQVAARRRKHRGGDGRGR